MVMARDCLGARAYPLVLVHAEGWSARARV